MLNIETIEIDYSIQNSYISYIMSFLKEHIRVLFNMTSNNLLEYSNTISTDTTKSDFMNITFHAAVIGNLSILKYLLSIERANKFYETIYIHTIEHVCKKGHIDIVKYLLKLPNSYNIRLYHRCFLYPLENGKIEMVKYLLSLNPFRIQYDSRCKLYKPIW